VAYDVNAVKQRWEGHETPLSWGRYPVEHEPIRRHCHMLDDANPRFIVDGHCPPVMVDYFASLGPWPQVDYDIFPLLKAIPTPGDRLINLNQELEWFASVKVGDRLGARHTVLAIDQRGTRLDPLSVWIRTETTIVNQREELVAKRRNQILVHRTPEEIAAGVSRA
jgi:3-hydroxybutyryl-CoA dehydratase